MYVRFKKFRIAKSSTKKLIYATAPNFLAPKIVERILSGTQPRSLKLQDIVTNEIPDLWQEQLENWGFEKS